MTIEYTLPDFTSQDASTYKAGIDASVAVNNEMGGQFYTQQEATASMNVVVAPGNAPNGSLLSAQTLAIEEADFSFSRIDIVEINATGVASVKKGTPNAVPVAPVTTTGFFATSSILVGAGVSAIYNNNISDVRSVISSSGAAGSSWSEEFTNSSLTAGAITINHNLNSEGVTYLVTDADDKRFEESEFQIIDENNIKLTFLTTLVGTYKVTVQGGVFDSTEIQELIEQVEVTPTGDDKGVHFKNQVSVEGELIAGKDSYPVPIAFHCDVANTSGTVITSATDVTAILQTDEQSTTGLFGGNTAGKYLLVGSTEPFEGAKVKYDTLGTVEPANILGEFYENTANGWQIAPFMATNSDYPQEDHGWNISVDGHMDEQIFFGFSPLTRYEPETWEQKEFTINGTPITLYWARFRITSAITLDPIVEQLKIHTDRIEHEQVGSFMYGRARRPMTLLAGVSLAVPNSLINPPNEPVEYTPTATAQYQDNEFTATADDGFLLAVNREYGLDTSVPLQVDISYYVKGTNTGDVRFAFRSTQVNDGYVYNGLNVSEDIYLTETISVDSNLTRRTVSVEVLINQLEENAGIVIEVSRLAASAVEDTLAASIIITNVVVTGHRWKS